MRPPIADSAAVPEHRRPLKCLRLGILAIALLSLGTYTVPFERPWLSTSVTQTASTETNQRQLQDWLWEDYPEATQELSSRQPPTTWLEQQLDQARSLGWKCAENLQCLLQYKLNTRLDGHPAWSPRAGKTPQPHVLRYRREILLTTLLGAAQ